MLLEHMLASNTSKKVFLILVLTQELQQKQIKRMHGCCLAILSLLMCILLCSCLNKG